MRPGVNYDPHNSNGPLQTNPPCMYFSTDCAPHKTTMEQDDATLQWQSRHAQHLATTAYTITCTRSRWGGLNTSREINALLNGLASSDRVTISSSASRTGPTTVSTAAAITGSPGSQRTSVKQREQYNASTTNGASKVLVICTAVLDSSVTDANGKTLNPFMHGGQQACVREATRTLLKHPPTGDDGG
jgi:hypothetical protein